MEKKWQFRSRYILEYTRLYEQSWNVISRNSVSKISVTKNINCTLVEFHWCFVSKSGGLQIGLICWKLPFSSFKYRFYFIFVFTLFLMLTTKLSYKWEYIFVNISRSTSRVSLQIPASFCISSRVRKAEWMVILFRGFHFFEGYYHRTTKQQSERLYLICSIFIGVKKAKKAWN